MRTTIERLRIGDSFRYAGRRRTHQVHALWPRGEYVDVHHVDGTCSLMKRSDRVTLVGPVGTVVPLRRPI